MVHNIHITYHAHHRELARPISLEEWLGYVQKDNEMAADDSVPGAAVFKNYSKHSSSGNYAWFYYNNGHITVKNPDEEVLLKMLSIAKDFVADVLDDDGEFYFFSDSGRVTTTSAIQRARKRQKISNSLKKTIGISLIICIVGFLFFRLLW
jgi:hypothetical protein